jgi:multidrug efflux pump subunit AcrA (membrane-fusion protein)
LWTLRFVSPGLREAAQYEGEINALKQQVAQLLDQVASAHQNQARADDRAQLASQQAAAAVRRANEAEANAGSAASERDALRSEVNKELVVPAVHVYFSVMHCGRKQACNEKFVASSCGQFLNDANLYILMLLVGGEAEAG